MGKWQIEETCGEVYDSGPSLLFQLCWLCWLWNCEESFGEVRWCSSHSVIPSYPPILTPADAPDSLDLQARVLRWPAGSQHPGALKLGNLLCLYSDSHGWSSWMSSSSSNNNNLVSSLWIRIASYKVEDFFFSVLILDIKVKVSEWWNWTFCLAVFKGSFNFSSCTLGGLSRLTGVEGSATSCQFIT